MRSTGFSTRFSATLVALGGTSITGREQYCRRGPRGPLQRGSPRDRAPGLKYLYGTSTGVRGELDSDWGFRPVLGKVFRPHRPNKKKSTTPPDLAMGPNFTSLAEILGYMVGAGPLLLYTPIAVRVLRQRHADGLAISTWTSIKFMSALTEQHFTKKILLQNNLPLNDFDFCLSNLNSRKYSIAVLTDND